jgi:hypothetical protein
VIRMTRIQIAKLSQSNAGLPHAAVSRSRRYFNQTRCRIVEVRVAPSGLLPARPLKRALTFGGGLRVSTALRDFFDDSRAAQRHRGFLDSRPGPSASSYASFQRPRSGDRYLEQ